MILYLAADSSETGAVKPVSSLLFDAFVKFVAYYMSCG
jgi:hypothetical protein